MPFAADSIMVQRVAPTPSPWLRMADAQRMGKLTLVGTGCQDHVQVVCPANEIWTLNVQDSLGLISPQDDIAAGIAFYNNPTILRTLESLDRLDERLRSFAGGTALLNTLFACMRRQAAWAMPHASDPAAVGRDFLGRFCRMVFEDPYSRYLIQRLARAVEPLEAMYTRNLLESCIIAPFQLATEALDRLHAALHHGESVESHFRECLYSLVAQAPANSAKQSLLLCGESLAMGIATVQDILTKRRPSYQIQWQLMHTLYTAAGRPVPAGAESLDVLTQFLPLDKLAIEAFDANRYLWSYATHYFNGEDEKAAALYDSLVGNNAHHDREK
jgi:hypothetical protein